FMPPEAGRHVLQTGINDFEDVLKIQEPGFSHLSEHARGELLTGLADGWSRLGNDDKARFYFQRIMTELKGTDYEEKAKAVFEGKPEAKPPGFFNCSGCHMK